MPIPRRLVAALAAVTLFSACGDAAADAPIAAAPSAEVSESAAPTPSLAPATPTERPASRSASELRRLPAPTPAPTATPGPAPTPAPPPPDEASGEHGHAAEPDAGAATEATPVPSAPPGDLPSAEDLLARTLAESARWADIAAAEAEGYRSIGDAFTGYEHLVHPDYAADPTILDPTRPESLVYRVRSGVRTLVSAMYLLPPGATMEDVPDLGDDRAVWHLHDNLCFDEEGRLAGIFYEGECLFGGERVVTPPMLHVWVVEHPCGPFAGIEGHGRACDPHTH